MPFDNFTAARADVEYVTNLGQFRGDQAAIRAEYARTTGGMSDQALRTSIAQEKLNRAIQRSGADSLGAKRAALAYRKEIAAIAAENDVVVASTARAGHGFRLFQHDISAAGRGALAGSGLFKGLGRAVAFSSSLFLGGTGLIYALRAATHAAEEHQATESQLAAAVAAVGLNYQVYRKQIDDTLASQRALTGFTEEETTRAFTQMLRVTGNVASALRYVQIAQQISIGSGRDFTSVSLAIVKALAGQASGLKRLGIEIPKGVNGYRAVEIAAKKYANSIAEHGQDATLVQQRLNQSLHQTEVVVGEDVLPALTHYESHLDAWLSKTDNQKRLQRDVNTAVHDGAIIVKDAAQVVHLFTDAVGVANKVTGGFEHTVLLAFGAGVLLKLRQTKLGAALLRTELAKLGPTAAVAATETEASLAGVTTAETVAATRATALRGMLLGLGKIGAITIGIDLLVRAHGNKGALGILEGAGGGALVGGALFGPIGAVGGGAIGEALTLKKDVLGTQASTLAAQANAPQYGLAVIKSAASYWQSLVNHMSFSEAMIDFYSHYGGQGPGQEQLLAQALDYARGGSSRQRILSLFPSTTATPKTSKGGSSARVKPDRLTQIQLAVSNAQLGVSRGTPGSQQKLIAALKEEIDYDRQYETIQEKLYANAKTAKDRASHAQTLERLQSDEQSALDQITSINQANAQKAAELARKRAEAAKKAREQLVKRRKSQLEALTKAPVDLQIAEQTAKAHGASEERLLAIYEKERAAIEKQLKSLKQMGAAKKYILEARKNEASIQSKIDAINKKKRGSGADVFTEAAAEFAQYGSNVAGAFGPLSGQDARGLLGAILLENKKGNRTRAQVERNTRQPKTKAIASARDTAGFGPN